MWLEVFCWIDRVWYSKECACCAWDPNERLSVPSIFCLCFCMSEVISSFRSLRAGSQVFALLMLFLCVILHTVWSGKSLQLLCILPFGMLCSFIPSSLTHLPPIAYSFTDHFSLIDSLNTHSFPDHFSLITHSFPDHFSLIHHPFSLITYSFTDHFSLMDSLNTHSFPDHFSLITQSFPDHFLLIHHPFSLITYSFTDPFSLIDSLNTHSIPAHFLLIPRPFFTHSPTIFHSLLTHSPTIFHSFTTHFH